MFISEKYQDLAKKWRVRVTLDDKSSIFLKFNQEPTDKEVFARAEEYLNTTKVEVIIPEDKDKIIEELRAENTQLKEQIKARIK